MSGNRIMDQRRIKLELWIHHYLREIPGRRQTALGRVGKGFVRGELDKLALATSGSPLHFE